MWSINDSADVEMDVKSLANSDNKNTEGEGQSEVSEEPMLDMTNGLVLEDGVKNPDPVLAVDILDQEYNVMNPNPNWNTDVDMGEDRSS